MPQSGEFLHHVFWIKDRFHQLIHYVCLTLDRPLSDNLDLVDWDSRHWHLIERSVNIDPLDNDGFWEGAHVEIDIRGWNPLIIDQLHAVLGDLQIPGVVINDGRPHNYQIISNLTNAQEIVHGTNIMSLMANIVESLDNINHSLAANLIIPKRINALSTAVTGADAAKIIVSHAPDSEVFTNRISLSTVDHTDPLWQKIYPELYVLGLKTFSGSKDLRGWHKPFEFKDVNEAGHQSVTGNSKIVVKALDKISQQISPKLPLLDSEAQLSRS